MAYRLGRRISIYGVLSEVLWACRGITAGSVSATTELRLVLLHLLDGLVRLFPAVLLHIYVDDMFVHCTGPERHILSVVPSATRCLWESLKSVHLELSVTKSYGIASAA